MLGTSLHIRMCHRLRSILAFLQDMSFMKLPLYSELEGMAVELQVRRLQFEKVLTGDDEEWIFDTR